MDDEATCSLGPMSDRPLSVHVRAASLLWKKLKLSGLSNNSRYNFEDDDKENEPRSLLPKGDFNAIRDLEKYLKLVGSVIPSHPSYRRRKEDAEIKDLESRISEVRSLVKQLSFKGSPKSNSKPIAVPESNSYLKAFLTESNQNGQRPSVEGNQARSLSDKEKSSRGKVQEARVRAKIAALAGRKALNRTKQQKMRSETPSGMTGIEVDGKDDDDVESVTGADVAVASTPSMATSALSTPGMTNLSQFLFSSNSKSSNSLGKGEQRSVQKPQMVSEKAEPYQTQDETPTSTAVQRTEGENHVESHEKLMGEVDYMSMRQELVQMNRKFTNYWLRTSEGCSAMTELIQNVKDDSQQVHNALANELEQVSSKLVTSASKVEKVEHKVDGLEVKFDAMNNVLSSNLKNLCSIAMMSKEEEGKSEKSCADEVQTSTPATQTEEEIAEKKSNDMAADNMMYDRLTEHVAKQIESLESKLSGWESRNENSMDSKLDARLEGIKGEVSKCIELTSNVSNASASSEQLLQLASTVDQKVHALETRLSSHLSKTVENLEYFKEHSLGSHLDSKMRELKKEIMNEVANAKKADLSDGKELLQLAQTVDEKVSHLEGRLMKEIQQSVRLVEQKEQILESELDTRFSEWKKDLMQSAVKNEQLLSLRQTVDKNIENVEQRLSEHVAKSIQDSQESVSKTFDEKWMGLKKDLMGSTSAQDEYLDIMHKMSEKIKHLDSKLQEMRLTSESGFEWIQEEQTKLAKKVETDIEAKFEAIESKVNALQSNEAMMKSVSDLTDPLESKVNNAVEKVQALEVDSNLKLDSLEAKHITVEEKLEALQGNYHDISQQLKEYTQPKPSPHEDELKKIQNAQRDLYCGLYCTSKVLKEKILSVESKLDELKSNETQSTNEEVEDDANESKHELRELEDNFEKLQKQVKHLEMTMNSSTDEVRSDLSASIHDIKQSMKKQAEMLTNSIQNDFSKIVREEQEIMKDTHSSQFDQFKRLFEKRLVDHKKIFEQKLKDVTNSVSGKDKGDTGMAPPKRSLSRSSKTKRTIMSPASKGTSGKPNADEIDSQTKKLFEAQLGALKKEMKIMNEKLLEVELQQRNEGRLNLESSIEKNFLSKLEKSLCQSKDSKMQASELTRLLKQHVGMVEGKMELFQQSIHELTQSIAVAHAKLAGQDTESRASKIKISKEYIERGEIKVAMKKSPSSARQIPYRVPGTRSIRATAIQPRVNSRATPEKKRPLAFY